MAVVSSIIRQIQDTPFVIWRVQMFTNDTPEAGDVVLFTLPFQEGANSGAPQFSPRPCDPDMTFVTVDRQDIGTPTTAILPEILLTINGTPGVDATRDAECQFKPTAALTGPVNLSFYLMWFKSAEKGTETFSIGA